MLFIILFIWYLFVITSDEKEEYRVEYKAKQLTKEEIQKLEKTRLRLYLLRHIQYKQRAYSDYDRQANMRDSYAESEYDSEGEYLVSRQLILDQRKTADKDRYEYCCDLEIVENLAKEEPLPHDLREKYEDVFI